MFLKAGCSSKPRSLGTFFKVLASWKHSERSSILIFPCRNLLSRSGNRLARLTLTGLMAWRRDAIVTFPCFSSIVVSARAGNFRTAICLRAFIFNERRGQPSANRASSCANTDLSFIKAQVMGSCTSSRGSSANRSMIFFVCSRASSSLAFAVAQITQGKLTMQLFFTVRMSVLDDFARRKSRCTIAYSADVSGSAPGINCAVGSFAS